MRRAKTLRLAAWLFVLGSAALTACGDDAADSEEPAPTGSEEEAGAPPQASSTELPTAPSATASETATPPDASESPQPSTAPEDTAPEDTPPEPSASDSPDVDAGPPPEPVDECVPGCPEGELRCDDGLVQVCSSAAGCAGWITQSNCTNAGMVCVQDDEGAACQAPEPTCTDGTQNQDESDVDCGGPCAPCRECETDGECEGGTCDAAGQCLPSAEACAPLSDNPYASPNSLRWPLTSAQDDQPRPALGNSFGEHQFYGYDPPYIHTGVDIRGMEGDHVWSVADGNLFRPSNFAECEEGGGTSCRLYLVAAGGRYIYYYSHLRFMESDAMSGELRERISNAISTDYEIQPGTEIAEGERISDIADFYVNEWAHLHFSVLDTQSAFDGIDPLRALDLEAEAIFDDEPPRIDSLDVEGDVTVSGVDTSNASADVRCDAVGGDVQLFALAKDAFITDPAAVGGIPGSYDSIGVDSIRTLIRKLPAGELLELPWYHFDQAPFFCTGPDKGTACPTAMSEPEFYEATVETEWGSPDMGTTYSPVLWDVDNSSSAYYEEEYYRHRLQNSYGEPGTWAPSESGLHQVTVEASDAAGNRTARTAFVVLGEGAQGAGELAIFDSPQDTGGVPSDAGDAAVAASPDIIAVPQGQSVTLDTPPDIDVALTPGSPMDVYVRVHNVGCSDVTGIRVRLTSLRPGLTFHDADPVRITPNDDFVGDENHPDGLTLGPAEQALLGPFTWLPTEAELGEGDNRALLAELQADSEPATLDPLTGGAISLDVVKNENNVALRNVMSPTAFVLGTPAADAGCVQLEFFAAQGLSGAAMDLSSDDTLPLSLWAQVPGAELNGGTLTFTRRKVVTLPAPLSANTQATITPLLGDIAHARLRVRVDGQLVSELTLQQ